MAEEAITLERILQVYREESQRKALTPLEADFWERVQALVSDLEADLQAESAEDPNSAKAALLRDELKKVLKRRDQIYQYRERKQALLAASAASGAQVDIAPLTPLEEASFRAVLGLLHEGRQRAFGLAAEPPKAPEPAANPSATKPEKAAKKAPAENPRPPKPLVLLRILEDIPPFLGVDATYRLQKEDVVSLPPEVAKVLLDQGKAQEIHPRLETAAESR